MPTINERILEQQIKHSIFLERYKGGVLKEIIGQLNKAESDLIELIAGRLAKIEARGFDLGPDTTKRLNKLLDEIVAKRAETYSALGEQMLNEMVDFAGYEADFQIKITDKAGADLSLSLPSNAQLKAIVTSQPFQGRVLKEWFEGLGEKEASRIKDAIRIGMTQNQTLDEIVRRVRGTKAAKYQDGILEIGRRDAATIVRTAVAHVQSRAKAEVYKANSDVVKKFQHISTLDSRTTPICIKLDNKIYDDYGKVQWPPLHHGCRSVVLAYFEDEEKGTRASEFGPVPEETDYDTFLRKQSKEFQEDVLGVERARIYRQSQASIGKFIDKSGQFYTLKQLKAREL